MTGLVAACPMSNPPAPAPATDARLAAALRTLPLALRQRLTVPDPAAIDRGD
jgi:hypothetical protein